jgi:hypothetical protein
VSGWQDPPGVAAWLTGLHSDLRLAEAELAAARAGVETMMLAEASIGRWVGDPEFATHPLDREKLHRLQEAVLWVDRVRVRLARGHRLRRRSGLERV